MNGDEPTHAEIWHEINCLKDKVTVLSTKMDNMMSPKEYADLRVQLAETNLQLRTLDGATLQTRLLGAVQETVATKSDLEWIKQFMWKAIGLAGAILTSILIALVGHILIK